MGRCLSMYTAACTPRPLSMCTVLCLGMYTAACTPRPPGICNGCPRKVPTAYLRTPTCATQNAPTNDECIHWMHTNGRVHAATHACCTRGHAREWARAACTLRSPAPASMHTPVEHMHADLCCTHAHACAYPSSWWIRIPVSSRRLLGVPEFGFGFECGFGFGFGFGSGSG